VETAMIEFCSDEPFSAVITLEITQASIKLHEYLFPREILFLPQIHNKLIDVP
jgi:hypothetical protein